MSHVEHDLLTIPDYLRLLPVSSGVRIAQSDVLCVVLRYENDHQKLLNIIIHMNYLQALTM